MRARSRRIAVTASGIALLLAPLAGCGSDDPPAAARTTPPAPATSAPVLTTDAAPLSQAELWKAVVTAQDVPGFKVDYVQLPGSAFLPGIPTDRMPPVFPAACTPVYWSTQALGTYPPTARIDAMAHTTGTPEQFGNVVLTVYSAADAPKVMADLHNAITACATTHIERHDDLSDGISFSHPAAQPDPHLGDDAVSFHITQNIAADDINPDPLNVPMTFTVVRVGATIATFWNQGDATHTTPPVIAPQLIPAQITKLTTAHHQPA